MSDWEFDEQQCPKCGAYPTRMKPCDVIGCDDGWIDMHEYDDPMLFDEGDVEMCRECHGTGWLRWCGNCGYDLTADDLRLEETDTTP